MAGTQTTTLVKGYPDVDEGVVNGTVKTGNVLQHKGGSYGTVQRCATNAVAHNLMVAGEYGSTEVGGSYVDGERARYYNAEPGDQFYVPVAGSGAVGVEEGTLLSNMNAITKGVSNATVAGQLGATATSGNSNPIAIAMESVNTSGPGVGTVTTIGTILVEAI